MFFQHVNLQRYTIGCLVILCLVFTGCRQPLQQPQGLASSDSRYARVVVQPNTQAWTESGVYVKPDDIVLLFSYGVVNFWRRDKGGPPSERLYMKIGDTPSKKAVWYNNRSDFIAKKSGELKFYCGPSWTLKKGKIITQNLYREPGAGSRSGLYIVDIFVVPPESKGDIPQIISQYKQQNYREKEFSQLAGDFLRQRSAFYKKVKDKEPPRIEFTQPNLAQGTTYETSDDVMQIYGYIPNEEKVRALSVNGKYLYLNSELRFQHRVELQPGANRLTFKAIDDAGNQTEANYSVFRSRLAQETFPADATNKVVSLPRQDVDGKGFGRYRALVIGVNNYKYLPRLLTATKDARAVDATLRELYGFKSSLLVDADREEILSALDRLRRELTPQDNLLIYFAGHGYFDTEVERGYWMPVDAKKTTTSNWISNADITDKLKAIRAKHVLVVADSCYSGSLTRDVSVRIDLDQYLQKIIDKRARVVMTSGGTEPVLDSGGGENSIFCSAFLVALKNNRRIIDGTSLFSQIRRPVMLSAPQTPQYSDIRFAGHDGGDFIFVRK